MKTEQLFCRMRFALDLCLLFQVFDSSSYVILNNKIFFLQQGSSNPVESMTRDKKGRKKVGEEPRSRMNDIIMNSPVGQGDVMYKILFSRLFDFTTA